MSVLAELGRVNLCCTWMQESEFKELHRAEIDFSFEGIEEVYRVNILGEACFCRLEEVYFDYAERKSAMLTMRHGLRLTALQIEGLSICARLFKETGEVLDSTAVGIESLPLIMPGKTYRVFIVLTKERKVTANVMECTSKQNSKNISIYFTVK